jgi:hypothetical protein
MRPAPFLVLVLPLTLGGCLAKTAFDVATAPVRIASKGVDLATTSQSEADENRGRALRKREARLGELERTYDRQSKACVKGNQGACRQARTTYTEIQALLPTVPVEPAR